MVYTLITYILVCMQLAPMSTTTNFEIAAEYSTCKDGTSKHSLIFKLVATNLLQCGADLQWVSAFPSEAEILFPPLTFLQPTGRLQEIEFDNYTVTILEVTPYIG
jgi:hypothetical protein